MGTTIQIPEQSPTILDAKRYLVSLDEARSIILTKADLTSCQKAKEILGEQTRLSGKLVLKQDSKILKVEEQLRVCEEARGESLPPPTDPNSNFFTSKAGIVGLSMLLFFVGGYAVAKWEDQ